MRKPAVAIDGPAGSGKSTVARLLAMKLGFTYVDTGAMYRAAALAAKREGILDPEDDAGLEALLSKVRIEFRATSEEGRILLDGEDVTDAIRTEEAGLAASTYSRSPAVRKKLVELQRKIAEEGAVVMEGRDIGTVVLPDAEVKLYIDAEPRVRARRRADEMRERGIQAHDDAILEEVLKRDRQDKERELAPLKPAHDAIKIDTSALDIDGVVKKAMAAVNGANPREG